MSKSEGLTNQQGLIVPKAQVVHSYYHAYPDYATRMQMISHLTRSHYATMGCYGSTLALVPITDTATTYSHPITGTAVRSRR